MYHCILFDIDGTILDTKKASLLAAQQAVLEGLGKKITLRDAMFTFGATTLGAAQGFGFSDPQQYVRLVDKYYAEYGDRYNRLFPGMQETLDALAAKKIPMGIVTSKMRWEYDHDFDRFPLKGYFSCVVTADDCADHKPHPGPVYRFLEQTGFSKREVLFVGDMDVDSECARAAGIDFAFAGWSKNPVPTGVTIRLSHPGDLIELV